MKAMAIDLSMIIKKRDLEQRGKPCYKVSPMKMKDKLAKLKVFSMPQKVGSDPVSTLNILAKKQNLQKPAVPQFKPNSKPVSKVATKNMKS